MLDYYKLLSISRQASTDEIKEKIDKELRIWLNRTNSPQINRKREAERMVSHLKEAESLLLDEEKRADYDGSLGAGSSAGMVTAEADVIEQGVTLIDKGWQLLSEGNVADALHIATKATEKDGGNSESWALLAQAKFRWGEYEDAIYEYKRAINLVPNNPQYYYDIGTVYETVERNDEALKNYERAAQIAPGVIMYQAAIGGMQLRAGNYSAAVQILERCVAGEPDNEVYSWLLALAYNDFAVSRYTLGPDNVRYCISKESAEQGLELFHKALDLRYDDDDLRGLLASNIRNANWALKKHWTRPILRTIIVFPFVAILGVFVGMIFSRVPDPLGSFLSICAFVGVIAIWIRTGLKPGWKMNKKGLGY
jgi:tetratricopeptide (TPR) repeat protein